MTLNKRIGHGKRDQGSYVKETDAGARMLEQGPVIKDGGHSSIPDLTGHTSATLSQGEIGCPVMWFL